MTLPPTHNAEIMKVMFPGNSKALQAWNFSREGERHCHLTASWWELIRSTQTSVTCSWTCTWETRVITSYLLFQQPSNIQFQLIIQFQFIAPATLASICDFITWSIKLPFYNHGTFRLCSLPGMFCWRSATSFSPRCLCSMNSWISYSVCQSPIQLLAHLNRVLCNILSDTVYWHLHSFTNLEPPRTLE